MPTALKEAQDKVVALSQKAYAIVQNEDGKLTVAEQAKALEPLEADIKAATEEVQNLDYVEKQRKKLSGSAFGKAADEHNSDGKDDQAGWSIGKQFVNSKGYKSLIEKGLKGGNWTSGDIELKDAFTEGTVDAPGGGYAAATLNPNVVPGVVDIRFRTLTIADLFPAGATSSPLIRYLQETIAVNGAKGVKEGDLKPESKLAFKTVDETLHKIATFLAVTDEMLEDYAQAQSYIDARLALFIKIAEEDAILNGSGLDGDMKGLLNREGLAATVIRGTAPSAADDNPMDAIYRQITRIRITQFLEPDAVTIDPLGWEDITLSKNTQGFYYANGPFVTEGTPSVWGKKVAVTPAMATKTALAGAFAQGGQLFRKGGLTVEASNSHADYFQRNKTALRAEERAALAIYRPGAFGLVTNL